MLYPWSSSLPCLCLFQWQVRREKAIYHTLNKLSMDTSRKVLVAEAWCPLAAKPRVHEALRQAAHASSTQVGPGAWLQDTGITRKLAASVDC
jgi:hypothetical protein